MQCATLPEHMDTLSHGAHEPPADSGVGGSITENKAGPAVWGDPATGVLVCNDLSAFVHSHLGERHLWLQAAALCPRPAEPPAASELRPWALAREHGPLPTATAALTGPRVLVVTRAPSQPGGAALRPPGSSPALTMTTPGPLCQSAL